jgi:hypothetical protein
MEGEEKNLIEKFPDFSKHEKASHLNKDDLIQEWV